QVFDREAGQYTDLDPIYYDVAVGREQLGKNVLASVEQVFDREAGQYTDLDPIYYDVAVGREQLGKNVL
ncbi:hypothetical protein D9C01_13985, partial [Corynebacterium diphtheriae]